MRLAMVDVLSILSALIDATDEFVLVLDGEFRVVWSNRRAEALLGTSATGLAGRQIEEYIVPGGREAFLKLAGGTKSRRAGKVSFLAKRGQPQPLCFNIAPFSRESGSVRGFVLVGRNPDDRGIRQNPVDPSNGLATRMLSGFADPVFLIDGRSRKVKDCNRAAVETFGFSREEFIGRRLLDRYMNDEDRRTAKRIEVEAWQTYETAGVFQKRILYPVLGGGLLPCELMGLPFFGASGSLDTIIAILMEKTAETSREAELARLVDQINALAGELAAMAVDKHPEFPGTTLSTLGFTPRQVEILRLSTSGASAKEIGFELGIAESTVKNHLSAIYRKLGVKSKVGCISAIVSRRIRIE
jgi:PAS domain S-box-containing protein